MDEHQISDIVEYLLVQRKFNEADDFCSNLSAKAEHQFSILNSLGKIHFYQNRINEAKLFFEKASSFDLTQDEPGYYLSQIEKMGSNQSSQSSSIIRAAEKLIEDNKLLEAKFALEEQFQLYIDSLNDLAVVNIMMGRLLTANLFLEKVMQLNPADGIALENMRYLEDKFNISVLKETILKGSLLYENQPKDISVDKMLAKIKVDEFAKQINSILKEYSDYKTDMEENYEALKSLIFANSLNPSEDNWAKIEKIIIKISKTEIPSLLFLFNEWLSNSNLYPRQLLLIARFLELNHVTGRSLEYEVKGLTLQSIISNQNDEYLESVLNEKKNKLIELQNKTKKLSNIIFYSLNCSGVTAIEPIIREILVEQFRYDNVFDHYSNLISSFVQSNIPLYHWTHSPMSDFNGILNENNFKFICLIRDPRDACVSYSKYLDFLAKNSWPKGWGPVRDFKTEKDGLKNVISVHWPFYMQTAVEWLSLNNDRGFIIKFEDMKKDILQTIRNVFDYLELPLDEKILNEKFVKYSFESITKGKRGEEKIVMPDKYYYRKGTSGDWKNNFDSETEDLFNLKCKTLMNALGYY